MARGFKKPSFGARHVELRCEDGEVSIYATDVGLQKLIAFCRALLDDPRQGHIHLEDYELLTAGSLRGTIAVLPSEAEERRI